MTLGASAAERIGRVLAARLPFGRGLLLQGSDTQVGFRHDERLAIADKGDGLIDIELPPAALAELTAESQILDQSGAVVAEVG